MSETSLFPDSKHFQIDGYNNFQKIFDVYYHVKFKWIYFQQPWRRKCKNELETKKQVPRVNNSNFMCNRRCSKTGNVPSIPSSSKSFGKSENSTRKCYGQSWYGFFNFLPNNGWLIRVSWILAYKRCTIKNVVKIMHIISRTSLT